MLIDPFWLAPPLDMLAHFAPRNPIAHYEPGPAAHMGPFEMQPFQMFDFSTSTPRPQLAADQAGDRNPHTMDIIPYSNNPFDWMSGSGMPTYPSLGLYSNEHYTGNTAGSPDPVQNVNWGFNLGPWQWDMGHYSEPTTYPYPENSELMGTSQSSQKPFMTHPTPTPSAPPPTFFQG